MTNRTTISSAASLLSSVGAAGSLVASQTVGDFLRLTMPDAAAPPVAFFDDALRRAVRSDRPAFAIAAGHQAALRALLPGLPAEGVIAFCASEERGAHPRYIRTTLSAADDGWRLDGEKRWASLAPSADLLVVIASRGLHDGVNQLVPVVVPSSRAGISMSALDAPGLAPEIAHAVLTFEGVEVESNEMLPIDGYTEAVRPFRTFEDLYIAAALQACSLRHGLDHGWPHELLEDMLTCLLAMSALAREDLVSPLAHIGLAATSRQAKELETRKREHWLRTPLAAHWVAEKPGPEVAAQAKARRREVAWQRFLASRS